MITKTAHRSISVTRTEKNGTIITDIFYVVECNEELLEKPKTNEKGTTKKGKC